MNFWLNQVNNFNFALVFPIFGFSISNIDQITKKKLSKITQVKSKKLISQNSFGQLCLGHMSGTIL